jgi:hypothetical protein
MCFAMAIAILRGGLMPECALANPDERELVSIGATGPI